MTPLATPFSDRMPPSPCRQSSAFRIPSASSLKPEPAGPETSTIQVPVLSGHVDKSHFAQSTSTRSESKCSEDAQGRTVTLDFDDEEDKKVDYAELQGALESRSRSSLGRPQRIISSERPKDVQQARLCSELARAGIVPAVFTGLVCCVLGAAYSHEDHSYNGISSSIAHAIEDIQDCWWSSLAVAVLMLIMVVGFICVYILQHDASKSSRTRDRSSGSGSVREFKESSVRRRRQSSSLWH